jgi:hypothetical protein
MGTMVMTTERLLKELRKVAGEAVRRGVAYDDWMAECVPALSKGDRIGELAAINMCSAIWRDACEEEGLKI